MKETGFLLTFLAVASWSQAQTTIFEDQKLVGDTVGPGFTFGWSADVDGDLLVLGAPERAHAGGAGAGRAYVFRWEGAAWVQEAELASATGASGDEFGTSVAISGVTVVAGAPEDGSNGEGAATIFEQDRGGPGNWGEVLTVVPPTTYREFGQSVSVDGDRVVVGAGPFGPNDAGVFIFERDQGGPGNWGEVTVLYEEHPTDPFGANMFGESVAISGDTIAVGDAQAQELPGGSSIGAVFVFGRDQGGPGNWGLVKLVQQLDPEAGDDFGGSDTVRVLGDRLLVGARQDNDNGTASGSAYIFERDQGGAENWGQIKKLFPSDTASSDFFGQGVDLFADQVVVGKVGDDGIDGTFSGAAYVFEQNRGGPGNWGELVQLLAADVVQGGLEQVLGLAAAVGSRGVVVGAPYDDESGAESGAAYAYYQPGEIFADGFESGDTLAWSSTVP